MVKVLNYLKYIGIFFLFIVVIGVITSLVSLTSLNNGFISKLGIILTGVSFFVVSGLASRNSEELGYKLGIKLSVIFVVSMMLINLVFFKSGFSIDRVIYYIILICSGILGGSFGKNFKKRVKK